MRRVRQHFRLVAGVSVPAGGYKRGNDRPSGTRSKTESVCKLKKNYGQAHLETFEGAMC